MASIAEINVRIGARIDKMVTGLRQAERELKKSSRKLSQMGESLTKNFTVPISAIGGVSIKMASDLEKSFSKIENLVGVTGETLNNFKSQVSALSNEVGKSQTELTEALFTITSAGLKGSDAMDLLTAASKASVIGMGETKDIAKAATAIIQAYGVENITASEAVNLLTKTVREGNLEASELAPSIGKVIPLASQMGISFKEVGANIATFTRLGISASESVSALKALLGNLIKPSKAAKEVLAKYNLTIENVRDSISKNGLSATLQNLITTFDGNVESASALFGSVEGLTNILGTAGAQGKEYTKILQSMEDGINIVDEGFKKASETADQKFTKSLIRLQNASIQIGSILLPIFASVAESIGNLVSKFSNLGEGTQKVIIGFAGLLAATGPVIKAYSTFKKIQAAIIGLQIKRLIQEKAMSAAFLETGKNVKKMNLAMKATTVGLLVAGITAAVAAFQVFNNKVEETTQTQKDLISINTKAAQSVVEQKLKVEQLAKIVNDETESEKKRISALKKLQSISPKHFNNLDLEKSKTNDVTAAVNSYVSSIRKVAKVQAIKESLIDLNRMLVNFEKIEEIRKQGEQQGANQSAGLLAENDFEAYNKAIKQAGQAAVIEYEIGINKRINSLEKLFDKENEGIEQTKDLFSSAENEKLNLARKRITELEKLISKLQSGGEKPKGEGEKEGEKEKPIVRETQEVQALAAAYIEAKSNQEEFTKAIQGVEATSGEKEETFISKWRKDIEKLADSTEEFEGIISTMITTIDDYAKQGGQSFAEMGKAALKASADVVRAKMQEAVAAYISSKIALGPLGLLLAATGGAVVGTLFNKALSNLKIPALANGGLAYAPTLAMVGDNPNASINPEVIAPLKTLKSYMGEGSTPNFSVSHRISGSDLLVVIENANTQKQRTTGNPAFLSGN